MPRALLVLTLALLLAGCAAGPEPAPTPPDDGAAPAQAAGPTVLHLSGTTTAGIYWRNDPDGAWPALGFNVTGNTTALAVEVAWDDPLQDLDAMTWPMDVATCPPGQVPDPWSIGDEWVCTADELLGYTGFQNDNGTPGHGDSPSRLLVDEAGVRALMQECGKDPCVWQGGAWARTPVANLDWELWVSLFEGPVPDGYTAIPAG